MIHQKNKDQNVFARVHARIGGTSAFSAGPQHDAGTEITGIILFLSVPFSIGIAIEMTVGLQGHWLALASMSLFSMGVISAARVIRWGYALVMQSISLKSRQSDHDHHRLRAQVPSA